MKWEFFIPLISFLGLIVGIILAKVSPEEMKPGRIFFKVMRLAALFLIVIISLYYSKVNLILFAGGLSIGFFLKLGYFYLGAALAGAFMVSKESVLMIASLIFIYSMPHGTLMESKKKIGPRRLLMSALVFALPFSFLLTSIEPSYLLSSVAGLLVGGSREEF